MAWAFVLTLLINFVDSYLFLSYVTLKSSVVPFIKTLLPQLLNSLLVFIFGSLLFSLDGGDVFFTLIEKGIVIVFSTVFIAAVFKQYRIQKVIFHLLRR